MAKVYLGRPTALDGLFNRLERLIFWLLGVDPRHRMGWKEYAACLLLFNVAATALALVLLLYQGGLPLNALGAPGMNWSLAVHTSTAFNTNTDFQHYTGETQVSLLSSLLGLQVEMFTSAASGLAVAAAFIRGFVRRDGAIGNFWWDMVRSLVRVLLPVSLVVAGLFVLLDVPQTFAQAALIHPLGGGSQLVPLGPVGSWDAIEFLGTNGGGFFGANGGHPFQNPSPLTNMVAIVAMMLIPFGAAFMFGSMVRRPGETGPLIVSAVVIFLVAVTLFGYFESASPFLAGVPVSQGSGYLVGAEARFSLPESALFQVTSVYANVGSTSMALGSLTPGGQLVLLWGMFLQSTPGGDGTGFGMMLINALLAIFVGGLMVGRTPEYLGKKIGRGEVKWAAVTILSHPFAILIPLAVAYASGLASLAVPPGPHGFTIALYEFTSESANNGSGMGPIGDTTAFFNLTGAVVMVLSRYLPMLAMLAIGGSLARQTPLPPGPGTIKTESGTFTLYLIAFILIVTGLLFLPVLALGPFGQGGL
jgi:potassium-transporting ATPase potassium-binding subunit